MPTIGNTVLTLTDWAKRIDPNGKVPVIAELLNETNEVLDDMLWMESNLPTGHQVTVRTGLPTPVWRLLNQGVQPTKSTTAQITEGIGMLEDWVETDVDLAKLNGNVNAFRLSESIAHLEGMTQEKASTLFYGNADVNPEEFTGLATRYSSLTAPIGDNIIDGGGTGADNTSVWLIQWGPQRIFGIFPKGSVAGMIHEDLGIETVETTAGIGGNRMRAYRERWQWKCGIAVKDWRYAVRMANIDVSDLVADAGGAADLTDMMIRAIHRLPTNDTRNAAFYMNRTVFQMLDIQRLAAVTAGGGLTYETVDGRRIPTFRGIPIRKVDALTETEAQIT